MTAFPHEAFVFTRVMAMDVEAGKIKCTDATDFIDAIADGMPEVERCRQHAVDEVVSIGVQIIALWLMHQAGPGALDWPRRLQSWLDDWEHDFPDSSERVGYAALVRLLDRIALAVEISHPIKASVSTH